MIDARPAILSLSLSELETWLLANGAPAYRRKQIWTGLARGATSFDAMHEVPKALRQVLDRDFRATSLRPIAVTEAATAKRCGSLHDTSDTQVTISTTSRTLT